MRSCLAVGLLMAMAAQGHPHPECAEVCKQLQDQEAAADEPAEDEPVEEAGHIEKVPAGAPDDYADEEHEFAPQPDFRYEFASRRMSTFDAGELEVAVEEDPLTPPVGLALVRVRVRNRSPRTTVVRLSYRSASDPKAQSTRELEVARGATASTVLPVPVRLNDGLLWVESPVGSGRESIYLGNSGLTTVLAVGTEEQFQTAVGEPPDRTDPVVRVKAVSADEVPDQLSALFGHAAVVVSEPGIESLRESARRALEVYAASGGLVGLVRPGRAARAHFPSLTSNEPGLHPYAFGHVRLCPEEVAACARSLRDDVLRGGPRVSPQERALQEPTDFSTLTGLLTLERASPPPSRGASLLPQAVAPVGWFLLAIGVFAVAIGPGSLALARRTSPLLLVVTIPLIAFVTIGLIAGYSLVSDGFSIHAGTRAMTLLGKDRAVTHGVLALYANLAPGSVGLTSGQTEALVPSPGTTSVTVDWTKSPSFGAGFLPSRTYREWGYLSVRPSRLRLGLRQAGSELWVQNALGGRIVEAHLRRDDVLYRVAEVPEGGEALAVAVPRDTAFDVGPDFVTRFSWLVHERVSEPLREGEFRARVETGGEHPFVGMRLEHHQSQALYRGETR